MRKIAALVLALMLTLGLAVPALAADSGGAQGVVTDSLGRPVAGAEVEVYRLGQGLTAVLTTSESGAFRIDAKLDAGALWQLRVSAKGYHTVDTGWQDLARSPYQAVRMERLDGALRVTAIDQNGAALLARMLVIGAGGHVVIDTLDGDGLLELGGLAPGQYRVLVQSGTTVPWSSTVGVTAGSVASVTALLQPSATGVAGEVRDAVTGQPVGGGRVELLQEDQTVLTETNSTADGRFSTGIGQGEYGKVLVRVSARGYQPYTTAPVSLKNGEKHDFSGKDAVRLTPAVKTVGGLVLRKDGTVRKGVGLALEAKGHGWVGETKSGDDGAFRFENVPADPSVLYRVFVTEEAEAADTGWMKLEDGITDQLVLVPVLGGYMTSAYSDMAGTVLSTSGLAVPGAKVDFYRSNRLIWTTRTDEKGQFLATGLPGSFGYGDGYSPYTLRISKDGYWLTSQFVASGQEALTVHVDSERRTVVRATLHAKSTELRGRIVGNRGEAVMGAEVYLMDGPYSNVSNMVKTDEQGWYIFKNVPVTPGIRYSLQGKAAGYLAFAGVEYAPDTVERQSVPTIRLTGREALFTGQVAGAGGLPVSGAKVELRGAAGAAQGEATTDEHGIYRLKAALPATGSLTLIAGQKGYGQSALELPETVEPGTTVSHDLLILPATAAVSGRVLNAAGDGVGGVTVEVLQEGRGGATASVLTNADGVYRIEGVPLDGPGWFWLRVRPAQGFFAGSLRHQTELVPLLQLPPGQEIVTDLLVK